MRRKQHFSGCTTSLCERETSKSLVEILERRVRVTALHSCAARSTARRAWCRRQVPGQSWLPWHRAGANTISVSGKVISLLYPSLLLVSVFEHRAKLLLNLRDDDTLTKSRLCPHIWTRGIDLTLMGQRSSTFAVSPREASSVCTSALHRNFSSLNCHWDPGNSAGSDCLGNTLNCYIPSCQGHVPFLQLFSSVWAVLVGTASGHLSPEALKLGSSGWKKKL